MARTTNQKSRPRTQKGKKISPATERRLRLLMRRVYMAFLGLLVFALIGTGVWEWRTGYISAYAKSCYEKFIQFTADNGFVVRRVYLSGHKQVKAEDVQALAAAYYGQPLLAVSLSNLSQEVEQIGWIKKANVYRKLPDTIHVDLEERVPFAIWQYQGIVHLIDKDGAIITQGDLASYWNLPIIVGKEANLEARDVFALLGSEKVLQGRVSAIIKVGLRRWDVRMDNGIEIKLPEERPDKAWHMLAKLQEEKQLLDRDISMVDMRVPDRLYLC